MNVKVLADKLNAEILTDNIGIKREITGCYVCDLLSWVMAHANKGNVWITVHTNLNIVAVALLTEVACIIVPEGIKVEESTVLKARQEGICILSASFSAYEICCTIYESLKGRKV